MVFNKWLPSLWLLNVLLFSASSSFALPLNQQEEAMFSKQFLLALLPAFVAARPTSDNLQSRAVSLDQYITSQNQISFTNANANIGLAAGGSTKAGVIVASPSKTDPDYVYTWTRDSALTTHGLLEVSDPGAQQDKTLAFLPDYINAQDILQHLSNPSGSFSDLSGLAEPKFNVDLTAFTGPWGRPQRDGPALRARALMKYVELYPSKISSTLKSKIDSLILNDLDYTVRYWNTSGFDLWEEVNGSSFFTTLSHFHALAIGSAYFQSSNPTRSAQYFTESQRVRCFADSYWQAGASKTSYTSNFQLVGGSNGRSGLDANSIIAAQLYPASPSVQYTSNPCDDRFFSPCSPKMLSSLLAVVESFRGVYPINKARESAGAKAIAIGRYKEDVYYNGNPWHLTTLAPAEQLYRAVSVWNQYGQVNITSTSLGFFQNLVPGAAVGTYKKGDGNFEKVTAAVSKYADDFVAIVQQYTPSTGSLWEQYSKNDGSSLSARDLTWSYIAFLTTTHYRGLQNTATVSASSKPIFGAAGNATCPSGPSGGGAPSGTVPSTFKVTKQTVYGENVYLIGNVAALGGWDITKAIGLNAGAYTSSNPLWQTSQPVYIPQNTAVQYKYVLKGTDGKFTYEGGSNRAFNTPASGNVARSDSWQN
ncbi:hypothetical protein JCM5353_007168 [Sporobolomyces roseus]